jgi:hypothetical protein
VRATPIDPLLLSVVLGVAGVLSIWAAQLAITALH